MFLVLLHLLASFAHPTDAAYRKNSVITISLSDYQYLQSELFVQVKISSISYQIPPEGKLSVMLPSQLIEQSGQEAVCIFTQESDPTRKLPCVRKSLGLFTATSNAFDQNGLVLLMSTFLFNDTVMDPVVLRILDDKDSIMEEFQQTFQFVNKEISKINLNAYLSNRAASALSALTITFSLKYSLPTTFRNMAFAHDAVIQIKFPIVNSYLDQRFQEGILTPQTTCSSDQDFLKQLNCTVVNSTFLIIKDAFSLETLIGSTESFVFNFNNVRNPADVGDYGPLAIEIYVGTTLLLASDYLKISVTEIANSFNGRVKLSDSTLGLYSQLSIEDITPQGAFYNDFELCIVFEQRQDSLKGIQVIAVNSENVGNDRLDISISDENHTVLVKNFVQKDYIRNSSFGLHLLNFKNDLLPQIYPFTISFKNTKLGTIYEKIHLNYRISPANLTGLSLEQQNKEVYAETSLKLSFSPLLNYAGDKALVEIVIPDSINLNYDDLNATVKISGSIDTSISNFLEYSKPRKILYIWNFKTTEGEGRTVTVEFLRVINPKYIVSSAFNINIYCNASYKILCETSSNDNSNLTFITAPSKFDLNNVTSSEGLTVGSNSEYTFFFKSLSAIPADSTLEIVLPSEALIDQKLPLNCSLSVEGAPETALICTRKLSFTYNSSYISIRKFNFQRDINKTQSFTVKVATIRNPKTFQEIGVFKAFIRDSANPLIISEGQPNSKINFKMVEKNTQHKVSLFNYDNKKAGGKSNLSFSFETKLALDGNDRFILKAPLGISINSSNMFELISKNTVEISANKNDSSSVVINLRDLPAQQAFNFTFFNVTNPKTNPATISNAFFVLQIVNYRNESLSEIILNSESLKIDNPKIIELKAEQAERLHYLGLADYFYFSFKPESEIEADEQICVSVPSNTLYAERENEMIEVSILFKGKEVKALKKTKEVFKDKIIFRLSNFEQKFEALEVIGLNFTGFTTAFLEPIGTLTIQLFSEPSSSYATEELTVLSPKVSCDPTCETCEGNFTNCQSCPPAFFRLNSNSCVKECPEGFYNNGLNCQKCEMLIEGCVSCNGEKRICLFCDEAHEISENYICIVKKGKIDEFGSQQASLVPMKNDENSFSFRKIENHLFITYTVVLSLIYACYKKLTSKETVALLPTVLFLWTILENVVQLIFLAAITMKSAYNILAWIIFYYVVNFLIQLMCYRTFTSFLKEEFEYNIVIMRGGFVYPGLDYLTRFWNFRYIFITQSGLGLSGNLFTLSSTLMEKDPKDIQRRKLFYSYLNIYIRGSLVFLYLYLCILIFLLLAREDGQMKRCPIYFHETMAFLFFYGLVQAAFSIRIQGQRNEIERVLASSASSQQNVLPESSSIKIFNVAETTFVPPISDDRRIEELSVENSTPVEPASEKKLLEAKTAVSFMVMYPEVKEDERDSITIAINQMKPYAKQNGYFEEET